MSLPPLPSVDRLHAVLEACSFRCATALLAGTHSLASGLTLALQFGDRIAVGAGGARRLTIRCSVQINGGDRRARGVSYWQIRRLLRPDPGEGLGIAIEADLILGGETGLADILAHGGDVYRHLRRLIADARDTLHDLRIDDRPRRGIDGPVLRIEARFLGGLAAGRSGLVVCPEPVASSSVGITSAHLRMSRAACDCLSYEVLPDLARAIRAMILQAGVAIQSPPETSVATPTPPRWHS
jgi:hypothetical protein